jgi:hypothetical protein
MFRIVGAGFTVKLFGMTNAPSVIPNSFTVRNPASDSHQM